MNLLQAKNITKVYESEGQATDVLHGVSLELKAGESLAIHGGSGAGKSTLLHIIGTLDTPTTGEVFYKGENLKDKSDTELASFRNKNLGFIFQFHYLLGEFNALENVAMPARIGGFSKADSLEKAAVILDKLGMSHRASHFPSTLSGGEQQRVAIARALIMNPSVLLADEPTGNLDKKNSLIIQDVFKQIVEDFEVGLIVVTHDSSFSKAFQRTKEMKDGNWSYL